MRRQIAAFRAGVIPIVVCKNRLVQMEKTEKVRRDRTSSNPISQREDNPVCQDDGLSARGTFPGGIGLNWCLNQDVKVNLNHEYTSFMGGSANPALAPEAHLFLSRAQFVF